MADKELDKLDIKKDSDDALSDTVMKIAEHVVDMDVKTKTKVEALEDSVKAKTAALETMLEKGFADTADRMENMKNTFSARPYMAGRIENAESEIKSVLSESERGRIGEYEIAARQFPQDSLMRHPEVLCATEEWFRAASHIQLPRFHGKLAKNTEKLERLDKGFDAVRKADSLQEDTAAEGGYLIPTIVQAEITRLIGDASDLWPRCRQMSLRSKTTYVPSEKTACTINWIEEEGALTSGEPTFAQTLLQAEKLAARATMSIELLEDSAPSLLPWLLSVFTEKMGGELDKQMVLGDGSGPVITGIMNASGINALTSGTAAGRALTWSLLVSAFVGAGEQTARNNGVWVMSPTGYSLVIGLQDTTNQPIVHFGTATQMAPAGSILGRPIIVSNRFGGSGTLDDTTNSNTTICFGPPSSLLAGTRTGMRWDVTDQANWATYQVDARLIGRFAGNVGVPAAWTYLSHLTY